MRRVAKIPTRSSPCTCHTWLMQLGAQLWFIKRAMLPWVVASMTVSGLWCVRVCEGVCTNKHKGYQCVCISVHVSYPQVVLCIQIHTRCSIHNTISLPKHVPKPHDVGVCRPLRSVCSSTSLPLCSGHHLPTVLCNQGPPPHNLVCNHPKPLAWCVL